MNLDQIYQPIAKELRTMEDFLSSAITESANRSILAMSNLLLESPGKRIRPALVILSEKAASGHNGNTRSHDELVKVATAVELIHRASLIHDDVIDEAIMRHGEPSINARWGNDVSIALGDYIYSKAFELVGQCRNPDVFACMSQAISAMCEGELTQVCQRKNSGLSEDSYVVIIKKKTASLFAACCHAGTLIGNHNQVVQAALKEFGLNFGIAFQIADDCQDVISNEKSLGKRPGQDLLMGELTLPLMNLLNTIDATEKVKLTNALGSKICHADFEYIRRTFLGSDALRKTKEAALQYAGYAKGRLSLLRDSDYKSSLSDLADYVIQRTF
ncbi:MAG: polyprenyl synthetase family protein [Planctomycetota bacterium]|jgi:geranylgeranyl pyrophosphate synthase